MFVPLLGLFNREVELGVGGFEYITVVMQFASVGSEVFADGGFGFVVPV